MEKHRMLVIDDDPILTQIMQMLFEATLDLTCRSSGEEGVQAVRETLPEIVLLDIEMAGMDGYEVCRRIRELDLPSQPYIIFVSAHSDPVKRLAAYSVGGEDFVGKPLQPEELVRKVEQALSYRREIHELRTQAQGAMSVAMSAMTDSSALGICLQFFRKLFQISDPEQLMKTTLDTLAEFGLSATVQLRVDGAARTLNSAQLDDHMESLLLRDLSADQQHIVSYGSRTAFNYGPVSLLIQNMPVEDEERYGKLKDYLALMGEGAAERAEAMARDRAGDRLTQARSVLGGLLQNHQAGMAEARMLQEVALSRLGGMAKEFGLSPAQTSALLDAAGEALGGLCQLQGRQEAGLSLLRATLGT